VAAQPNRLNQMRFLQHPENLVKNKHPQMFFTSGFAIAAGVVAVGSAAYGAYATSQATKAQGRSMGNATKNFKKQQKKIESLIMSIDPTIKTPEYNPTAVSEDLGKNWPAFKKIANEDTQNTINQLEKIQPGSANARAQAMQVLDQWKGNLANQYVQLQDKQPLIQQQQAAISSMIGGQLPDVVQEQINRAIAERAGAGFNPATAGRVGGFQTAQAQLADQLRQSSEQRMLQGLQLAPGVVEQQRGIAASTLALSQGVGELENNAKDWMRLAAGFITTPTQMAGVGIQLGGLREQAYDRQMRAQQYSVANQLAQAEALGGVAQGTYAANMNQISQQSMAAQQNIQAQMGVGQALSGALSGVGAARQAQFAAQNAGGYGGLNTATGFYGSQAGAMQATGKPASAIGYYQPKGGGGGFYPYS
jgi:hypothetical protein